MELVPNLMPEGDYVSPGLDVVTLDRHFPHMCVGDRTKNRWPYLRRSIRHNWYVDKRNPTVGFVSRDEAILLYNLAKKFKGAECLEVGCWRGWSTAHLALGSNRLDVIDPVLADPEFRADVAGALERCRLSDAVSLYAEPSPAAVHEIAKKTGKRWSFAFIDGDHEGQAPVLDTEAVHQYAADDAMIVLHDLISPDVADALKWLRANGWRTYIYQTMQIVGVAVRGNVEPVPHTPDPTQRWALPAHLTSFPIVGESRSSRLQRLAASVTREAVIAPQVAAVEFDAKAVEADLAAIELILEGVESEAMRSSEAEFAFDQMQRKHVALIARLAGLEHQFTALRIERDQAKSQLESEQQAKVSFAALNESYTSLNTKYSALQYENSKLQAELDAARTSVAEQQTIFEKAQQNRVPAERVSGLAIRSMANWLARKRTLFGLVRRLSVGQQSQVRHIVQEQLRLQGFSSDVLGGLDWLGSPRVILGLAKKRLLADHRSVAGYITLTLEQQFGVPGATSGRHTLASGQVLGKAWPGEPASGSPHSLEAELAKLKYLFAALEQAKLENENALLDADLTIARLTAAQTGSFGHGKT